MIVNWNKYEKETVQSSRKSAKNNHSNKSSHSNSRSYGKDFQYTNDPFLGDFLQEKNSSITSANSLHNNLIESKDKEANCYLTEIDMSEIYDYKVHEDEDFFISHMESSINFFDWRNNNPPCQPLIQSSPQINSTEALNKAFLQKILNKKTFISVMSLIDQNPYNFLQMYFSMIICNFQEIIFNNMSYALFIKLFPYFTKYHKEIFFNKILKSYFNLLYHNQYGVEVLNQFIFWILNDSILVNVLEIIKLNLVELVIDENGYMVILSLLNQRNAFISKIIYDAIVNNLLVIALNANGVKVIIHLMTFSNSTQRLIEAILKSLNKLIIHLNGHLLVIYLLSFHVNGISSFIINYLCTNIAFFASDESGGKVIEECLNHCDEVTIFPLVQAFYIKEVVKKLCTNKIGCKILRKVVDHSSQPNNTILLNQIKAETRKE